MGYTLISSSFTLKSTELSNINSLPKQWLVLYYLYCRALSWVISLLPDFFLIQTGTHRERPKQCCHHTSQWGQGSDLYLLHSQACTLLEELSLHLPVTFRWLFFPFCSSGLLLCHTPTVSIALRDPFPHLSSTWKCPCAGIKCYPLCVFNLNAYCLPLILHTAAMHITVLLSLYLSCSRIYYSNKKKNP